MTIYCDRLTFRVCVELVRLRLEGLLGNRSPNAQILDPVSSGIWARTLVALMKLIGVNIDEAQFFAGHLKSTTGGALSITASHWAHDSSYEAADRVIESSPFLSELNTRWGRNTIRLHLTRRIWVSLQDSGRRILVASALTRESGEEKAVVLVTRPNDFDPSFLIELGSNLEVRFYRPFLELNRTGRFYLLFWLFRNNLKELQWWIADLIRQTSSRRSSSDIADKELPSVLLIQESDVSLDRSYRTQPHWLFEAEERPSFQTYILRDSEAGAAPIDDARLKGQGIEVVSRKDIALARRPRPQLPVQRRLNRDLRHSVLRALFGRSRTQIAAAVRISQLFFVATRLPDFCRKANIRAFMTSENYHPEVDAIRLMAPVLGIQTLSYQFANASKLGPVSLTNGDTMLMFSSLFHPQYAYDGIGPDSFVDIGYPFESSFPLVRERAKKWRRKLEAAGAKFVICYFDEGDGKDLGRSANGKYRTIAHADHISDLLALMQLVLDDPTVGLVLKSKQLRTSPRFLDEISELRDTVEATGRYAELICGTRRNIVFPAEAALCSEIVIGNAIGATAVLESVLTGTRGLLTKPYDMSGAHDALYAQADIVYPSLEKALEAVAAFRAGEPERQNLGDWSAIIDQFDPIRDGQSGHRMRAALEKAMAGIGVPS